MEDIAIIGAGGFGREVKLLIDQINKNKPSYNILGFYDDSNQLPKIINGCPNLGNIEQLLTAPVCTTVALGIGVPQIKKAVIERLQEGTQHFTFPSLIHPGIYIDSQYVDIGEGTIICGGSILTCNIVIESFVTVNLNCTVGHDSIISSFSSIMPSVNISGEVTIEPCVYVGTGAKIINQISIGENTVVGAGAVVSKSLPKNCTAVGIPAKPIKFHS
jgi:sugar O-acyltransferase (sialic acid O-acetyltransferase NeuD family)